MKNQINSLISSKTDVQIILALEASANQLSVAVMIDGTIAASRQRLAAYGHAVGIVSFSIDVVNAADVSFETITHVAAGCGPALKPDHATELPPIFGPPKGVKAVSAAIGVAVVPVTAA